ncbi:response regulator transcription factor [Stenotrophomonas mori]|uniref:Response regulator transcription factor n=1 Tax=Stenotrophomonas mori TaxID=2871096 RepID=A0ABT0SJQ1_9GAMM|nr:response regulator transcription factor [Stenotrophomonas mori]MCL7715559.1 response regulator transcription factor [Stenotrophomonas mori]
MLKLRIVIADDHPLVLMGIREVLERDPNVVVEAAAHSPSELIQHLDRSAPDVVITDYHMPDDALHGDGIQFIGLLLRRYPGVRLLVLTMLSNPMIVASLYDAGVSGVILKQHDLTEVSQALHTLRRGQRYYPPGFTKVRRGDRENPVQQRIDALTPREFEVLRLFVQGHAIGEIGEHLNRSIKTVSTQKTSAMRKLGVESNQALIGFCTEHGLFLN